MKTKMQNYNGNYTETQDCNQDGKLGWNTRMEHRMKTRMEQQDGNYDEN